MTLVLQSSSFSSGQRIPAKYARDGENLSPSLTWSGAPAETKSYALVVEDPDAPKGTFRHWAIYDIPAGTTKLAEGAGSASEAEGLKHGVNDFGNSGYDGPQPPPGHGTHHYHFRLLALDAPSLEVRPGAKALDIREAAQKHTLAEAEIVGTFER
jgi:Raf kinase inhibitor-like YbhB/YbcL family protein